MANLAAELGVGGAVDLAHATGPGQRKDFVGAEAGAGLERHAATIVSLSRLPIPFLAAASPRPCTPFSYSHKLVNGRLQDAYRGARLPDRLLPPLHHVGSQRRLATTIANRCRHVLHHHQPILQRQAVEQTL